MFKTSSGLSESCLSWSGAKPIVNLEVVLVCDWMRGAGVTHQDAMFVRSIVKANEDPWLLVNQCFRDWPVKQKNCSKIF